MYGKPENSGKTLGEGEREFARGTGKTMSLSTHAGYLRACSKVYIRFYSLYITTGHVHVKFTGRGGRGQSREPVSETAVSIVRRVRGEVREEGGGLYVA